LGEREQKFLKNTELEHELPQYLRGLLNEVKKYRLAGLDVGHK
jgi:hypothetical protein